MDSRTELSVILVESTFLLTFFYLLVPSLLPQGTRCWGYSDVVVVVVRLSIIDYEFFSPLSFDTLVLLIFANNFRVFLIPY